MLSVLKPAQYQPEVCRYSYRLAEPVRALKQAAAGCFWLIVGMLG